VTALPPTGSVPAALGALAEPVEPVRRRWVARITLASIGLWAGFFGPIQVLLAQQAAEVAPGSKEFVFGLVTGVGAAVSVVSNPLFGALSDRTTLVTMAGGYTSLYLFSAGVCLLGSVLVYRIRSVR